MTDLRCSPDKRREPGVPKCALATAPHQPQPTCTRGRSGCDIRRSRGPRIARLLLLALATALIADAQPPLPEGLAPPAEERPAAPALPEGLGQPARPAPGGPALPEGLGAPPAADEPVVGEAADWRARLPFPLHGFWELRGGTRFKSDPTHPKTAVLGESRLQLKTSRRWDWGEVDLTADTYLDLITEKYEVDLRQVRLTWTPIDSVDIRAGRQILTWGTGDLLFINDLFPKDWQSFLIGRDQEYLKAPSDSIKVGWFHDAMNIEFVYTPQFEPDRFITGERVSYWNPLLGRRSGYHEQVDYNAPSTWFNDDEIALRLYRNIGSYEFAIYGYSGYWKSPAGQRLIPLQATFPKLRVYGASLRGKAGRGIGNVELGYYDSYQDRGGGNPFVNNSEFRVLLGYEQDIGKELTASVQYYLEHMMDYRAYRNTLPFFMHARKQDRSLVTLRLTKLLMNQNLTLSWFMFYSPSDDDAYFRPKVSYKITDNWLVEAGGNIFLGAHDWSFFGQFEDSSNIYAAVRYSF
jgi:hypothetical protein